MPASGIAFEVVPSGTTWRRNAISGNARWRLDVASTTEDYGERLMHETVSRIETMTIALRWRKLNPREIRQSASLASRAPPFAFRYLHSMRAARHDNVR